MGIKCKICSNSIGNRIHIVKEMHFEIGEEFNYVECHKCGCLQIADIPKNIIDYYPDNYYAFSPPTIQIQSYLKRFIKRHRLKYMLGDNNLSGKLLLKLYGKPKVPIWLNSVNLKSNSKILDIGSGLGLLLIKLNNLGFTDLTGIDPYVNKPYRYSGQISVLKKTLEDINNIKYDFVMLHHSFEHMQNPKETLANINKLLKLNCFLLIRIPVASCYAWKKYGVNWVQLDAPRHFFLHTKQSIGLLANSTGFSLENIIYDSTEFQFISSELYKKGIPLIEHKKFYDDKMLSTFFNHTILDFRRFAEKLNQSNEGDQATFILKKKYDLT